ncbi:hypothetical protein HDK64DRAFT_11968 [Phyllosticta capitalensis]
MIKSVVSDTNQRSSCTALLINRPELRTLEDKFVEKGSLPMVVPLVAAAVLVDNLDLDIGIPTNLLPGSVVHLHVAIRVALSDVTELPSGVTGDELAHDFVLPFRVEVPIHHDVVDNLDVDLGVEMDSFAGRDLANLRDRVETDRLGGPAPRFGVVEDPASGLPRRLGRWRPGWDPHIDQICISRKGDGLGFPVDTNVGVLLEDAAARGPWSSPAWAKATVSVPLTWQQNEVGKSEWRGIRAFPENLGDRKGPSGEVRERWQNEDQQHQNHKEENRRARGLQPGRHQAQLRSRDAGRLERVCHKQQVERAGRDTALRAKQ